MKQGIFYNSLRAIEENLFGFLVGAAVLGGIGTWTHQMYTAHQQAQIEIARIDAGLELVVGDYNGNELLDKFYMIDGQKVPLEIDGISVAEYFR
jgi:hypothetical protein